MTGEPTVKIDAFCHIMPRPYYDRFFTLEETVHAANLRKRVANIPCLVDMDVRFAQMDEFGDYRQLINICAPPVEDLGSPEISRQMARIGNEALAELVRSHPDRFAGFCACVPMDDPDAAVAEMEYATRELGAVGAQIYTHVHGEAMDAARFDPFYAAAARSGSLVQVHPCRSSAWADYPTEQRSRYEIWWTFGWEYDLSAFMARIVFSGVLERYPDLKLLIHHGGSMVPHFSAHRPGLSGPRRAGPVHRMMAPTRDWSSCTAFRPLSRWLVYSPWRSLPVRRPPGPRPRGTSRRPATTWRWAIPWPWASSRTPRGPASRPGAVTPISSTRRCSAATRACGWSSSAAPVRPPPP